MSLSTLSSTVSRLPMGRFDVLPNELISMIMMSLTVNEMLVLARACREWHMQICTKVYREVDVVGIKARRFFLTVSSPRPYNKYLPDLVHNLTYTSASSMDVGLTYVTFSAALALMSNLSTLTLSVKHTDADFLLYMLRKNHVLRVDLPISEWPSILRWPGPHSTNSLSRLTTLNIDGDLRMLQLVRNRPMVKSIKLSIPLGFKDLQKVIDTITGAPNQTCSTVVELSVYLIFSSTFESILALWAIDASFPKLSSLEICPQSVNATNIIHVFTLKHSTNLNMFQDLTSLGVGEIDDKPRFITPRETAIKVQVGLLDEVSAVRKKFKHARFGSLEWARDDDDCWKLFEYVEDSNLSFDEIATQASSSNPVGGVFFHDTPIAYVL